LALFIPLFGNAWKKSMGKTKEDLEGERPGRILISMFFTG